MHHYKLGEYRVVVHRLSLKEMTTYFTLRPDQDPGKVVANPHGINVTLEAEYWRNAGTSTGIAEISDLTFEWFYVREDGGENRTFADVTVRGGKKMLKVDTSEIGVFVYFAREKESGTLVTPQDGLRYDISFGAMDMGV